MTHSTAMTAAKATASCPNGSRGRGGRSRRTSANDTRKAAPKATMNELTTVRRDGSEPVAVSSSAYDDKKVIELAPPRSADEMSNPFASRPGT
jgi:hypothetical protein